MFTRSITILSLCVAAAGVNPALAAGAPKRSPELFFAVGQRDAMGVKALLSSGVDPNSQNTLGMSALMIAAATGDVEIVKTLLEKGADVNFGSMFGSPLTFAAFEGQADVMRLLLEKGADVAAKRPDQMTVLMLAARNGNPEIIRELIARKANVAAVDNNNSTALSYAARAGKSEAVRVLLEAGAKVDIADNEGWTPLMHAAVNGHADTAALLVKKGANLAARDKQGRTPLVLAVSFGDHPEVVRLLVNAGAPVETKDAKGRTALALATRHGYTETAKVLREKGAKQIVAQISGERTPRQAVEASLPRIEHSMKIFAQRTGCASCHHEGVARFATGFAASHGYKVDANVAKEGQARVLGMIEEFRPFLEKAAKDPAEIKNVPIVDVGDLAPTYTSLVTALGEHQTPKSQVLADAALVLARSQTPDGDWRFGFHRVPVQSSFFTMTALSIRVLQQYGPKEHAAELDQRIAKAKQWLLATPAKTTEDLAFRVLGLKWAGATVDERRKAVDELRAAQQADGGWAQEAGLKTDAYGTGIALFALNQGGDVPVAEAVYQNGVRFLVRTQAEDGTWYVYKRAIPANNYFDAEYPYGQSQYISHTAAAWATVALILAAEKPAPRVVNR